MEESFHKQVIICILVSSLAFTQLYIEGDSEARRKIVDLV